MKLTKILGFAVFVLNAQALAEEADLSAYLSGNSCLVTNNEVSKDVQLERVDFLYHCEDNIIRRARERRDDILIPQETLTVAFPGPEGGCMNYFIDSCKAVGQTLENR